MRPPPIRHMHLDRPPPRPDHHQVEVGVGLVDGLVLRPGRDEGEVARPQLVPHRLLVVVVGGLREQHAGAGDCVEDGFWVGVSAGLGVGVERG